MNPDQPADEDPHADQKTAFSVEQLGVNMQKIDNCRAGSMAVGGIFAGILGCTGYQGVVAYLVVYVLASIGLLARMGFRASDYVLMRGRPAYSFLWSGCFGYMLSFVMCWTLAYCLVYIY